MANRDFARTTLVDGAGHARSGYRIACSACDAEKKVCASGHTNSLPVEALNKKFRQAGWTIGKSASGDLCPACTNAHWSARHPTTKTEQPKAEQPEDQPMKPTVPFTPKIVSDEPRQMGRDDRRIVFEKLNEVYVDEKVGYANGWSDKTVAESLGCPQKWVEMVRDEMFGPVRVNDESAEFAAKVHDIERQLLQLGAEIADSIKSQEVMARQVSTLREKQAMLVDAIARLNKTAKTVERLYN